MVPAVWSHFDGPRSDPGIHSRDPLNPAALLPPSSVNLLHPLLRACAWKDVPPPTMNQCHLMVGPWPAAWGSAITHSLTAAGADAEWLTEPVISRPPSPAHTALHPCLPDPGLCRGKKAKTQGSPRQVPGHSLQVPNRHCYPWGRGQQQAEASDHRASSGSGNVLVK